MLQCRCSVRALCVFDSLGACACIAERTWSIATKDSIQGWEHGARNTTLTFCAPIDLRGKKRRNQRLGAGRWPEEEAKQRKERSVQHRNPGCSVYCLGIRFVSSSSALVRSSRLRWTRGTGERAHVMVREPSQHSLWKDVQTTIANSNSVLVALSSGGSPCRSRDWASAAFERRFHVSAALGQSNGVQPPWSEPLQRSVFEKSSLQFWAAARVWLAADESAPVAICSPSRECGHATGRAGPRGQSFALRWRCLNGSRVVLRRLQFLNHI